MADIGEESEFHLIDFLRLLGILLHLTNPEFIAFTALHRIESQKQTTNQQENIAGVCPRRHPERRQNDNLQTSLSRSGISVTVGSLHLQDIGTGSQIGIGDTMHIGHARQPIVIEPFQFIEIPCLFGQHIIVGSKQHGKCILFIIQHHFFSLVQSLRQYHPSLIFLADPYLFIEKLETGKHYFRQSTVVFYIVRTETVQTVQSAHHNFTRVQAFKGTLVEVTTLQTVLIIISIATKGEFSGLAIHRQHDIYQLAACAYPNTFPVILLDTQYE